MGERGRRPGEAEPAEPVGLALTYKGVVVDDGEMDAYRVGALVTAFTEFLGLCVQHGFGEALGLRTTIRGVRQSSFEIDFALRVADSFQQAALLAMSAHAATPTGLLEFLKAVFALYRHLDGKAPQQVVRQGDNIQVTNRSGNVLVVTGNTFNLVHDAKAGKAIEQVVDRQLGDGVDLVSLFGEGVGTLLAATIRDRGVYRQIPEVGETVDESVVDTSLTVQSLSFAEGNLWRFADASGTFLAQIEDEGFLARVESGDERFGKGDRLDVLLRITRRETPTGKISWDRVIVEVKGHKEAERQHSFL